MATGGIQPKGVKQTPGRDPLGEWEKRYDEWSDRVYRYLLHLNGSREVAEDLFQDTWMRALDRRHQLTDHDRFGPWILRIARNLTFNANRKRSKRVQVHIWSQLAAGDEDGDGDLTDREPGAIPGPRDKAIQHQRAEIIQEAVARLDSVSQEMLQLRYFEELTMAEIAELLEVPIGTVCTKVHRGLKHVRKVLERQGYRTLSEI